MLNQALAALSLALLFLLGPAWSPPTGACSGCNSIDHGESVTSTCISIINNNFAITPGTCTGTAAPCSATPCQLSGSYTVTNNCNHAIYIRTAINSGWVMGTVEVQSGNSHDVTYDDFSLACGQRIWVRIYESDPGECPATTTNASWSFECTACK